MAQGLKTGKEREVWDCTLQTKGVESAAILTIFKPGSPESVNTNLPPAQAVQKCALAMKEMTSLGVPTPRVMGYVKAGKETAILCEKIECIAWSPDVRIAAARAPAHILLTDLGNRGAGSPIS